MKKSDKKFIDRLIKKDKKSSENIYRLSPDSFSNEDIIKGIEVLLTKKITMSEITKKFEKEFAKFIGSKYALMVNSGSSANLLALSSFNFKKGSEVITPNLTFSTTVAPIYQLGLIPHFIGVEKDKLSNLNRLKNWRPGKSKISDIVKVIKK